MLIAQQLPQLPDVGRTARRQQIELRVPPMPYNLDKTEPLDERLFLAAAWRRR
jgi:hypothetical protein